MRISDWSSDVCSSDLIDATIKGEISIKFYRGSEFVISHTGIINPISIIGIKRRHTIGFMLRFPISDGLAADIAQFITQCEFLVGIICREIERIDRVAQFALKPFRLRWIINIGEIGSFAHPIADEAENQPDRKSTRLNSSH